MQYSKNKTKEFLKNFSEMIKSRIKEILSSPDQDLGSKIELEVTQLNKRHNLRDKLSGRFINKNVR